jgi:hypothetical protein
MLQVYKMTGKDNVESRGVVRTRQATGLMNIVKPGVRLEVGKNFFSVRSVDIGTACLKR